MITPLPAGRFSLLLCGLLCSLLIGATAMAASAFSPGQKVVVNAEETPAYESFADTKKPDFAKAILYRPAEPETRRDINVFYVVLAQKDGWLHVREDQESSFWVAAKDMIELDAFLADPANADIVACPDSVFRSVTSDIPEALPRRFTADLDSSRKNAVLRMVERPTLGGGEADMQVWSSDEKTLLGTTADTVDFSGDKFTFDCYRLGVTWPEIVGDVNGDGNADFLYLSKVLYRSPPWALYIYSWNGKSFAPVIVGFLVTYDANMPASISTDTDPAASMPDGARHRIYLNSLLGLTPDGAIKAEFIQDNPSDDNQPEKVGIGAFRLSKDNKYFLFEGWLEPLKEVKDE